jgi:hypothetical protein
VAVAVIKPCATVFGACRRLRMNLDEVWGIMSRGVQRSMTR